jgi:hypothetical protein
LHLLIATANSPEHVNTILEIRLRGILLALQCVSSSLADEVRRMRNSFVELPTTSKQGDVANFKTFTATSPIPHDLAQAVLRMLEIFNQCETGQNYRGLGGQTSADLVEAWRTFIS